MGFTSFQRKSHFQNSIEKVSNNTIMFVGGITGGIFETIREENSTNQCCLGVIIIHVLWNYKVYEMNTFAVLLLNRCCRMLFSYCKTKSLLKLLLG